MPSTARHIAIASSSAYVGVMLTIGVGLGGYWLSIPPADFASQFEQVFPRLLPCIALTLLPALVSTTIALRASAPSSFARRALASALAALVVSIVVTVVYHVPTNLRIWSGTLGDAALAVELRWWLAMHAVRWSAALAAVILTVLPGISGREGTT